MKNEEQKDLNRDLEFRVNDSDAYGIYNGISEYKIQDIIRDIRNQHYSTVYINAEAIARILNHNNELKQIALDTYKPLPFNEGWTDEYKAIYYKRIIDKTFEGTGTIPNKVIREKLTSIILDLIKKDNEEKAIQEAENKAKAERQAQFKVSKVYKHINPSGGEENGQDGYYDADITDDSNTIRFVAKNVFDFGFFTYPKRVEGTDNVFNRESWTDQEKKVSEWLYEFSPIYNGIRM